MQVTIENERYLLRFEYQPAMIDFCRSLQGARYHANTRSWSAARSMPNALDLRKEGYYHDKELLRELKLDVDEPVAEYSWVFKDGITLYKHQEEFREWVRSRSHLLMDVDMGLGKTLMALFFCAAKGIPPEKVLVVCPTTLILNWDREIRAWAGLEPLPIMGTTTARAKAMAAKGLHIVNYEYLYTRNKEGKVIPRPGIMAMGKTTLIIDEAHLMKNPQAARSKALHHLFPYVKYCVLGTGTPVSQGLQDYYSMFKMVNPRLLGPSFTSFKNKYCIQEAVRGAPVGVKRIVGYRNIEQLMTIISPFVFSRRKEDCVDLPDKVYTTRLVEMTPEQRRYYRELLRESATYVQNAKGDTSEVTVNNVLSRGTKLVQVCQGFIKTNPDNEESETIVFEDNPKIDALAEVLDELQPEESIVVMCRFLQDIKAVTALLVKRGLSHDIIQGSVSAEDRARINAEFQEGKFRVLIGQIQTAGTGLNLHRASKMVFFSNDYSLVNRKQAEDRIHRIGTTADKCLYIDIVTHNGIDMDVLDALRNKKDMAQTVYKVLLDYVI